MRSRRYRFLVWYCGFKHETLNLLNDKNLRKLAEDYGFKGTRS